MHAIDSFTIRRRPLELRSLLLAIFLLPALLAAQATAAEPAKPAKKKAAGRAIQSLFNGRNLDGWIIATKYDFKNHGRVSVDKGELVLERGKPATGVAYGKPLPRMNYELTLDAKRVAGDDFFCGLTFPVGKEYCTLIVGGWGGGVTGLSNIDNMSAIENDTTGYQDFKRDKWCTIRLRVTPGKVEAWIGKEQIVDLKTADRALSIWWEQEPMRPLGIATWNTSSRLRNIKVRSLAGDKKSADDKKRR